jgi:hypothetical protein
VPEPGGRDVEPGVVVVVPPPDGMVPGFAYASLLGDNVPALVTTLLVAVSIIDVITFDGDAVGTAER